MSCSLFSLALSFFVCRFHCFDEKLDLIKQNKTGSTITHYHQARNIHRLHPHYKKEKLVSGRGETQRYVFEIEISSFDTRASLLFCSV